MGGDVVVQKDELLEAFLWLSAVSTLPIPLSSPHANHQFLVGYRHRHTVYGGACPGTKNRKNKDNRPDERWDA